MKLSELKKLTNNELALRFPFIIVRNWNGELAKDEDGNYYLEINGMNGWRDLLLCWAEKVKPIYDSITDENLKNNFYLTDVKEKWGCLRIEVSYILTPKVYEFTLMAEYLSKWTCINCGKIIKSSNSKHIIIYRQEQRAEVPFCKKCNKKDIAEQHLKILYKREVGNWYTYLKSWKPEDSTEYIKYDCRELLEGM